MACYERHLSAQGLTAMSGGASAQDGFTYQKDYVAFRVIASEAKRLLLPDDVSKCIVSFKVEGRQAEEGPAWDVAWTLENGIVHLRECKDTAITRPDRETFYRRVRRKIANGTDFSHLRIGWTTDEGKQSGDIFNHLAGMAIIALSADEIAHHTLPSRVDSADDALAEALYYLSWE